MEMNFIIRCICVISLILVFQQCSFQKHVQQANSPSLVKDSVIVGYENRITESAKLVPRQDSNLVILSFFEEFNDTVILYLNGIEKWRASVNGKDSPNESSGYSGVDVGVSSPTKNNTVQLRLLRQRRFVEF